MPTMKERVEKLHALRAQVKEMGGAEKVAKQHEKGKLSARERIAKFLDDGTFVELGILGTQMPGGYGDKLVPADAVVAGSGKVNGRPVCLASYDFTVKGGSLGPTGEVKVSRLRELALRSRIPMVWFIDSAGARIDISMAGSMGGAEAGGKGGKNPMAAGDFISFFANTGHLFREESIMSGVVPLISAMMGPGAAGTAYIPGLADYVPMVKNIGSMALAGPPLVKAVTGEVVDEQTLGGSKMHSEVSGVGDGEFENDEACLKAIRTYLSFMPSSCMEKPPVVKCSDPIDRKEERLLEIVPESTRQAFDVYEVIKLIADEGAYFDIKPRWARNVITCFARFGGFPVGIVANNSKYYGGVLDINAADKAAHFIEICDSFNVPLLFLHDTPGFMVGTKVEKEGIIRHGAKMLHCMSQATVPKLSLVMRKSYGAGYYAMCGRAYEPDLLLAWPGAEISVMGAEGMVGIAGRAFANRGQEIAPAAAKAMAAMIQPFIDITKVAHWGFVDDLVDPRETRERICRALEMTWNKQVERPWRKHSVRPV